MHECVLFWFFGFTKNSLQVPLSLRSLLNCELCICSRIWCQGFAIKAAKLVSPVDNVIMTESSFMCVRKLVACHHLQCSEMSKNATELTTESSSSSSIGTSSRNVPHVNTVTGIHGSRRWRSVLPANPRNTTARKRAEAASAAHKTVKLVCAQCTVHASSTYTFY